MADVAGVSVYGLLVKLGVLWPICLQVMAEMESNLLLQGATANEDRLQEDVPQTIALLAEAGIQFFMLTGATNS
jgi:hypothetical protein